MEGERRMRTKVDGRGRKRKRGKRVKIDEEGEKSICFLLLKKNLVTSDSKGAPVVVSQINHN